MRRVTTALLCLAFVGCKSPAAEPDSPDIQPLAGLKPAKVDTSNIEPMELAGIVFEGMPKNPKRPRWAPSQPFITFYAGNPGKHRIFIANNREVRQLDLGEGDFVDPDFSRDGSRIVYAARTDETDGYDLFVVDLESGERERLSDFPGDEREPTVNPLLFGFYGVKNGVCGSPPSGVTMDGYEKVIFAHREKEGADRVIRYTSLTTGELDLLYGSSAWRTNKEERTVSANGTHAGKLTESGDCHSPRFSGDGLSALWTCDAARVNDGSLRYDMTFKDALAAVENDGCAIDWNEKRDWTTGCLDGLPKRYSSVETDRVLTLKGLNEASYSTNQIEVITGSPRPMAARRVDATRFESIPLIGNDFGPMSEVVWSPDGSRIIGEVATDDGTRLKVLETDAYLQDVVNLDDFPELWTSGDSERLQNNRFVARQSAEKEYYVAYDKLRYEKRPQFITADTALQVFRDEFQIVLKKAEVRAADDLRQLSAAMMKRFAAKNDTASRYLAIYFATAWVPLESAHRLEEPTWDELVAQSDKWGSGDAPRDPDRPSVEEMFQPAAERIPKVKAKVLGDVPPAIRSEVDANITAMYASKGIGKMGVPGFPKPIRIDWTQFRPRGSYAQSKLAGYFYAMSWFGQAPLPFERKPLDDLLSALEGESEGTAWMERWTRTDALVGAFMGKPGAANLTHLEQTRADKPGAWKSWNREVLVDYLAELRGEVTLRDLDAAMEGEQIAALKVMLFPKRVGLDTTFFRALVAPDVKGRFTPSPLDAFAVLGASRAEVHALQAAKAEAYADRYKAALQALKKKHGELATTDIYHAWIGVLMTLADNEEANDLLAYTQSDAWRDRTLHSALVGYTQLKHAAVLYNMQDMGIQCDGENRIFLLTERPIVPEPRGSVDPYPEFFRALAGLADRVYERLNGGEELTVTFWWDEDDRTSARQFALDLSKIAEKVRRGSGLTEADYAWIRATGGRLEALLMRTPETNMSVPASAETRIERGVAIATDVHTQVQSRQVLQLGLGRLLSMWVAVPQPVGARLTQGYIGSYYEFLHPMDDRLTDEKWNEMLEAGAVPQRPEWTASFVEE